MEKFHGDQKTPKVLVVEQCFFVMFVKSFVVEKTATVKSSFQIEHS